MKIWKKGERGQTSKDNKSIGDMFAWWYKFFGIPIFFVWYDKGSKTLIHLEIAVSVNKHSHYIFFFFLKSKMCFISSVWHQDFKELVLEKLRFYSICSQLRFTLCFSILKAMAENQWNNKVILHLNNIKTIHRTWMSSFILLNKKLLSGTLLNLKSSHDSLINSSLSFAKKPSGSVSFSLKMCPWSNFHLLLCRESIHSNGGPNLSTVLSFQD